MPPSTNENAIKNIQAIDRLEYLHPSTNGNANKNMQAMLTLHAKDIFFEPRHLSSFRRGKMPNDLFGPLRNWAASLSAYNENIKNKHSLSVLVGSQNSYKLTWEGERVGVPYRWFYWRDEEVGPGNSTVEMDNRVGGHGSDRWWELVGQILYQRSFSFLILQQWMPFFALFR